MRPAAVAQGLLAALQAADGRRRRRQRDTRPDSIGLAVKRALLEGVVAEDPEPDDLEGWLLGYSLSAGDEVAGAVQAMAREVLAEWRLAVSSPRFRAWLDAGAPSDDRAPREP